MSTATLNIQIVPRRMLSQAEAANYCGLPLKHFGAVCPCHPVEVATGKRAWDISDLDRWLDSLKDHSSFEADAILEKLAG